jgi:outer membrane protein
MKQLRFLPLALLLALPFALPVGAQTKPKKVKARVAVVDVDRCVGETEDGLRAKAALGKAKLREDSMLFAMEERLKAQEADLQARVAAHQQTGATTIDPKIQAAALDYQKELGEYQAATKQAQNKLAQIEDTLFDPIERKVKGIFKRIAEQQGFDLLVDRRSMPISLKPELDLTEQVIKEYNWGPPAAPSASTAAKTP